MKTKIVVLLLLISFSGISQISYQKGYYIDNNNNKIEGFIKNYDWKNNPTSFEFKRNLNDMEVIVTIDSAKEFGIDNKIVYIKSNVEIERSSEKTANIGYKKEPVFNNETLFLKLIVSGKNALYYYYNDGIEKFFYRKENNPIKQLVFIKYKIDMNDVKYKEEYKNFEPNSVFFNEYYKKQLWLDVRCPETLATEPSDVKYTSSDLSKYFAKINNCNGSIEKIEFEVKKTIFSVKAVVLINKSKISFKTASIDDSFDESIGFGVGADLEFLFPFNNYKWSLFIEPSFNNYNTSKTIKYGLNNSLSQNASLKMNSIQVPIGIRYHFDVNNNSKIFLGAGLNVMNVNEKVKIDLENSQDIPFGEFTYNFIFSTGYKYKRINAEIRWHTKNNVALGYYQVINFSRLNLVLKYEIFKK